MKVKLPTADVIEFSKRTRHIKANFIIPITAFIKVECAGGNITLYKTNLGCHCKHTFQSGNYEDVSFLIDERTLLTLCGNSSSSQLAIEISDNSIILTDGQFSLSLPVVDVKDFPTFPDIGMSEPITVDSCVVSSIAAAQSFLQATKDETGYHSAYIVHNEHCNDVFGGGIGLAYMKSFEIPLPNVTLTKEQCAVLSGLGTTTHYYTNSNHVFYEYESTVYSFVKSDWTPPAYWLVMKNLNLIGGMTISKADLQHFCNLAVGIGNDTVGIGKIIDAGSSKVKMCTSQNIDVVFDVEKDGDFKTFNFMVSNLVNIIKALPYNYITLTRNGEQMAISTHEDEDFTALLSGVAVLD